ncbi:glycoside hydrolase family 6 protein [Microbacterium paludicola]|uniref:glycoside hydrolase family 6 protein n=1 Tax=Microbacterium paludicola TaxID=300019 RepID=UPI00387A31EA
MPHASTTRRAGAVTAAALVLASLAGGSPAFAANDVLDPSATLWTNPDSTTLEAAKSLTGQAREDAEYLAQFPTATWFTAGTPITVKQDVKQAVVRAHAADEVPVLVAYNVPFRDCAQYSSGGATTLAEYTAWIDGFAKGIGNKEAVVILEPDGLGIIPHYTSVEGAQEWCQPAEADAATAASERFAMLNHAVDTLAALPNTAVYLDGTHSGWLNVGDISDRLIKAGVEKADGFFLNASNYHFTANLTAYGHWISSCIALVTELDGAFADCGSQYWNGGPANNWSGVAMDSYGEWSAGNPDPALDTSGVDSRYASQLGDVEPTTHFVLDTSRNGQGPWEVATDYEDWCNPLDRGLGLRPTTDTGDELIDAYLWIKVPGESDGECLRGTAGPEDPARGVVDPRAGGWFPDMARELIENAVPAVG